MERFGSQEGKTLFRVGGRVFGVFGKLFFKFDWCGCAIILYNLRLGSRTHCAVCGNFGIRGLVVVYAGDFLLLDQKFNVIGLTSYGNRSLKIFNVARGRASRVNPVELVFDNKTGQLVDFDNMRALFGGSQAGMVVSDGRGN